MTLFIAFAVLWQGGAGSEWYALAIIVWLFHLAAHSS